MILSGRLLSVNDYHRTMVVETERRDIVLHVPKHVARRIKFAAIRAARQRKALTVKAFDATPRRASRPRLADPVKVREAIGSRYTPYTLIRSDNPPVEALAEMDGILREHGFRINRTGTQYRGYRYEIVVNCDSVAVYDATRVHCERRRLPSGDGRMPIAGSSGMSEASWMDRNNPLR